MLLRWGLELVQDFYTEQRVFELVHDDQPGRPPETLTINQPDGKGGLLNNVTRGRYDVVVATMPSRDTFNDVQFGEALNLREVGVQIPDHHVLMYSNLVNKAEVAEEVKQLAGLGEKSPEQQAMDQQLQQIQVQTLQAQLDELLAKSANLKATATLNYSRAGEADAVAERELRGLEQKMQQAREEIAVRERLADAQAESKLDVVLAQHRARLAELTLAHQAKLAEIKATPKPKPATTTTKAKK